GLVDVGRGRVRNRMDADRAVVRNQRRRVTRVVGIRIISVCVLRDAIVQRRIGEGVIGAVGEYGRRALAGPVNERRAVSVGVGNDVDRTGIVDGRIGVGASKG